MIAQLVQLIILHSFAVNRQIMMKRLKRACATVFSCFINTVGNYWRKRSREYQRTNYRLELQNANLVMITHSTESRRRKCNRVFGLRSGLLSSAWPYLVLISSIYYLAYVIRSEIATIQEREATWFPMIQMDRDNMSRAAALRQIREALEFYWANQTSLTGCAGRVIDKETMFRKWESDADYRALVEKGIDTLEGLGFYNITLCLNSADSVSYQKLLKRVETETAAKRDAGDSAKMDVKDIKSTLCYPETFTLQESVHRVDPKFCPKLLKLFNEIKQGTQDPLITLILWMIDPIYDPEKHTRKLSLSSFEPMRPFVRPVLVTNSRWIMSYGNSFGWPVVTVGVEDQSSHDVPIFSKIVQKVKQRFNSTFYGYFQTPSIIDPSLLETLIRLKELYQPVPEVDEAVSSEFQPPKRITPMLIFGRSLFSAQIRDIGHPREIGQNAREGATMNKWKDEDSSHTYAIFSETVEFPDIPPLIVDDKYLSPFLAMRSRILGHVVVNATNTILSVFLWKGTTVNEWNRKYVAQKPRDPHYNQRLGDEYLGRLKQRKSDRPSSLLQNTRYGPNGEIVLVQSTKPEQERQGL